VTVSDLKSRSRSLNFIAQNSPGSIIGYSAYNPSTAQVFTTVNTTMAYVVDGSSNKKSVTFTAPATGKVEIAVSVWVEQNPTISSTYYLRLALSTDSTTWSSYSGTDKYAFLGTEHNSVPSQAPTTMRWVIDSLPPGRSTTFYLGAGENVAGSQFSLHWGGTSEYPAMVIKATTLPRKIST